MHITFLSFLSNAQHKTNAWNGLIAGKKKWIFYPPGVVPPGVTVSPDGADVTEPISTGEWCLAFWKFHLVSSTAQFWGFIEYYSEYLD